MIFALPALKHVPSPNYSLRGAAAVRQFVVHDCEGSYAGAIGWFAQVRSQVSAHIVLRKDGLEATQCVPMDRKAWHACAANPIPTASSWRVSRRTASAISELDAAAAIVAWGLKRRGLPCRSAERGEGDGFCSHYDLGAAGGGHLDITTDRNVWLGFAARVEAAYSAFAAAPLPDWALDGLPPLRTVSAPPAAPIGWSPSGTIRKQSDDQPGASPLGSILWARRTRRAEGPARACARLRLRRAQRADDQGRACRVPAPSRLRSRRHRRPVRAEDDGGARSGLTAPRPAPKPAVSDGRLPTPYGAAFPCRARRRPSKERTMSLITANVLRHLAWQIAAAALTAAGSALAEVDYTSLGVYAPLAQSAAALIGAVVNEAIGAGQKRRERGRPPDARPSRRNGACDRGR